MANKITIGQVIRRIQANEISPAYSLFGNESFLQDFFIQILQEKFLAEGGFKRHMSMDDDREINFLNELSIYSLFDEKKLIILRQVKKLSKKGQDELMDYLISPNTNLCIVLIGENFDQRNALQKKLNEKTLLIDVRVPFENKMREWISYIAKVRGYQIKEGTISEFINMYGDSIAHVINEIEKIALLNNFEGEIELQPLSGEIERAFHLWELQDAIGKRDLDKTINILHSLLQNGITPPQIIVNLTNLFHQLLWLKMDDQSPSGYTGLNMIITKKLNSYSRQYSIQKIQEILKSLRESDLLKKSTALADLSILEPIMIKICKGKYA